MPVQQPASARASGHGVGAAMRGAMWPCKKTRPRKLIHARKRAYVRKLRVSDSY